MAVGGGGSKFYPYKKVVWKSFSRVEGDGGRDTKCFGVVLTRALEVLDMLKGFYPLKGGGSKMFYPVLRGWGAKTHGLPVF